VYEREAWWRAVDSKYGSSWGGGVLLSLLKRLVGVMKEY